MNVFWHTTPCNLLESINIFAGTSCFQL